MKYVKTKTLKQPVISVSFSYESFSAHNADLYEQDGWAFKHLIKLGKQGWEVIKIQEIHDTGSWVLLKNCHHNKSKKVLI